MGDYIGSTLSAIAEATSPEDATTYAAKVYSAIGKMVTVGEFGDSHSDLVSNYLDSGRANHSNGTADGGEIPMVTEAADDDAGLVIIEAANGTNNVLTFEVADPDGISYYFQGVVANLKHKERTTETKKGYSFVIRVNTGVTADRP